MGCLTVLYPVKCCESLGTRIRRDNSHRGFDWNTVTEASRGTLALVIALEKSPLTDCDGHLTVMISSTKIVGVDVKYTNKYSSHAS